MEVVVTTGAVSRAKLQSKCHHQQTNTHFLQAKCPSNQQCRMSEEMYSLALSLQHTEVELYSGRRDVFLKSFWDLQQQQQQQPFYGHFPEQPG